MRLVSERQLEGHLQLHTGEAESESELLLQQTKQSPVFLFRKLMSSHDLCGMLSNKACSNSACLPQRPHILE